MLKKRKKRNFNPFKHYKDISIMYKLFIIFTIIALFPTLIFGIISYTRSTRIIIEETQNHNNTIKTSIKEQLSTFFDSVTDFSQELLYEERIYEALDSYNSDINITKLDEFNYRNSMKDILTKAILSQSEINSIAIFTYDWTIYSANKSSSKENIEDIIPYMFAFVKAQQGDGRAAWYIDYRDEMLKNIYLVRIIKNRDTLNTIGLMTIQINSDEIQRIINDINLESMLNFVITDSRGRLLYSKNNNFDYLTFDENNPSDIIEESLTMDTINFKFTSYISKKLMFKELDTYRNFIIKVASIILLIVFLLSFMVSLDIVRPIKTLTDSMKKMKKGTENIKVNVDRNDEIGYLSHTFNRVTSELNHLVKWVYREQITRKDAQLKALQAQINPHFLFNTLESINCMAQLEDVPQISDTVSDLATLMEISIGRDDELITVREELKYIESFIRILKKRFEEGKIELILDIEDRLYDIKIPRLLLQPLFENAVYHGVETIEGSGIIRIKAYKDKRDILFIVQDNGVGIERDRLSEINNNLQEDCDTYFKNKKTSDTTSIGIENVNRRIKLYYGDEYGVKIESQRGQYTRVIAIIKYSMD